MALEITPECFLLEAGWGDGSIGQVLAIQEPDAQKLCKSWLQWFISIRLRSGGGRETSEYCSLAGQADPAETTDCRFTESLSQNTRQRAIEKDISCQPVASTCTHTGKHFHKTRVRTHTHTCVHTHMCTHHSN